MRRLSMTLSSITVIIASWALRHGVRSPRGKRFLASCCEIVEPPATTLRASGSSPRPSASPPVEALVVGELRVLGGDDGALQARRDARVRDPLLAQLRLRLLLPQALQALLHERGGLRVVGAPPGEAHEDGQLVGDEDRGRGERGPPRQAREALHAPRRAAMTPAVSASCPATAGTTRPPVPPACPGRRSREPPRRARRRGTARPPRRRPCRRRWRRAQRRPREAGGARRGEEDVALTTRSYPEPIASKPAWRTGPAPAKGAREVGGPRRRAIGDDELGGPQAQQGSDDAARGAACAEQQDALSGEGQAEVRREVADEPGPVGVVAQDDRRPGARACSPRPPARRAACARARTRRRRP